MSLHSHISAVAIRAKEAQASAGTDFSPGTAGFGKVTDDQPAPRQIRNTPGPRGQRAKNLRNKSDSADGTQGPATDTAIGLGDDSFASDFGFAFAGSAVPGIGLGTTIAKGAFGLAKALGFTHGVLGATRPAVGSKSFDAVVGATAAARAKDKKANALSAAQKAEKSISKTGSGGLGGSGPQGGGGPSGLGHGGVDSRGGSGPGGGAPGAGGMG
jgi:hypothetical protein